MNQQNQQNNIIQETLDVVIIGNQNVGKTSIMERYYSNYFAKQYKATIGLDFRIKNLSFSNDGIQVNLKLCIWDMAGTEINMAKTYFKRADVLLLVCDLSESSKIEESVEFWRNQIEESEEDMKVNVKIVLALNKCDLVDVSQPPVADIVEKLGLQYKADMFITSAAEGIKIKEMFDHIIKFGLEFPQERTQTFSLADRQKKTKKNTSCC